MPGSALVRGTTSPCPSSRGPPARAVTGRGGGRRPSRLPSSPSAVPGTRPARALNVGSGGKRHPPASPSQLSFPSLTATLRATVDQARGRRWSAHDTVEAPVLISATTGLDGWGSPNESSGDAQGWSRHSWWQFGCFGPPTPQNCHPPDGGGSSRPIPVIEEGGGGASS